MSQKPFMWNGDNAVEYDDPSGYYHLDNAPPDDQRVGLVLLRFMADYRGTSYHSRSRVRLAASTRYARTKGAIGGFDASTAAMVLWKYSIVSVRKRNIQVGNGR